MPQPSPLRHVDACLECGQPFSAVSAPSLELAVRDHVHYVNVTKSRADDVHFEEHRMVRLIHDLPASRS